MRRARTTRRSTEVAAWPNANLQELWIDANVADADRCAIRRRRPVHRASRESENADAGSLHAGAAPAAARCSRVRPAARSSSRECHGDATRRTSSMRSSAQLAALARAPRQSAATTTTSCAAARCCTATSPCWRRLSMDARRRRRGRPVGLERFRMEISDGREVDLRQSAVHWEIARMLLDFVAAARQRPRRSRPRRHGPPVVSRDRGVDAAARGPRQAAPRSRARAVSRRSGHSVPERLRSARPTRASPIQTAVRSAVLPTGVTLDVGSERVELREAEATVPARARAQARITRKRACATGACSACCGRHAEAAVELRRAAGELTDPELLVLRASCSLARRKRRSAIATPRARRTQRAAELSPQAQSPLLALSELARRYGDRTGALRAIDRLFALSGDGRDEHDDPVVVVLRGAGAGRRRPARRAVAAVSRRSARSETLCCRSAIALAAARASGGRRAAEPGVLVEGRGRARRRARHRQRPGGPRLGPADFECSTTACRSRSIWSASSRFR